MSNFYRRFIRDYAKSAKPLTLLLRGENGRASKFASCKIKINLTEEAIDAFHKLKNALMSEDVLIAYPDFNKEVHLTTAASSYALGSYPEKS